MGAAVAVSPTLPDLPAAGAEIIRMAIRLEVVSREIGEMLEATEPNEAMGSWATLVSGLDAEIVQKELDVFNTEMVSFFNHSLWSSVFDKLKATSFFGSNIY